jgi:hypothetical protein
MVTTKKLNLEKLNQLLAANKLPRVVPMRTNDTINYLLARGMCENQSDTNKGRTRGTRKQQQLDGMKQ